MRPPTPTTFFKTGPNSGLVRSKAVRDVVSARVLERFQDSLQPDACAHDLGTIATPDGVFRLIVRHAVDLVILVADRTAVVLIQRSHPPGAGKWALPGGFLDAGETARAAALREAEEETGLLASLGRKARLSTQAIRARLRPVPPWRIARRFDIRGTTWLPQPLRLTRDVTLRPGDLMAVTTQPYLLVAGALSLEKLVAGDDAEGVSITLLADLEAGMIGVADHLAIIRSAVDIASARRQPANQK